MILAFGLDISKQKTFIIILVIILLSSKIKAKAMLTSDACFLTLMSSLIGEIVIVLGMRQRDLLEEFAYVADS